MAPWGYPRDLPKIQQCNPGNRRATPLWWGTLGSFCQKSPSWLHGIYISTLACVTLIGSFGLLHRSRNGCLALSSEQRRVALVVSAGIPSIGSPLVGASVVCGASSRLVPLPWATLSERSGRFCKLVHGRGGTCYLCGVVCRCGRERGLPLSYRRDQAGRNFRSLIRRNERIGSFCKLVCFRD